MAAHIVKVLEARFITYDVKLFKVEKPEGYNFIPGQATVISINLPEWKEEIRPFSFTNLRDAKYLEFMVKIYKEHNGVTKMMGKINAGDELIIHDVFGAIHYEKPGVFIAAGSGITPFISIFRDLYSKNKIKGNRLIYVNKTREDIIMGPELFRLLKKDFINVLTREHVIGYREKRIDRNYLIQNIIDFSQYFYVCGPDDFVKEITEILLDLGAEMGSLVFEK